MAPTTFRRCGGEETAGRVLERQADRDAGPMTGFPPPRERQVNVSNWLQPQNVRWAFRHMREIMPTQLISAGTGGSSPLPTTDTELGNPVVVGVDGSSSTVEEIFAGTFTDAVMVLHEGEVVAERYFEGMTETTRHLVMSVSKSIVGCVAGVLGVLPLQLDWNQACSAVVRVWADARTAQSVRRVLLAVAPELTFSVTIMPGEVCEPAAGAWLITVPAGVLASAASITR